MPARDELSRFRDIVLDKRMLDDLYTTFNDKRHIAADPVQFIHRYGDQRDREIVGLIASSLAFGNVNQIHGSVDRILDSMGSSPTKYLLDASPRTMTRDFRGFKHRWITGADMASMLAGVKRAIAEYGSLGGLFCSRLEKADADVVPASGTFAEELYRRSERFNPSLLPSPRNGSACKKLNLFLRWMVRSDEIDPGGWSEVAPSMLIVPLDVHMHRLSLRLGITKRLSGDLRTAREITEAFRAVTPEDPVKYDFALTHLAISRRLRREEHAHA
jgi:uncharacterized protein (TIGR02757 family)